MNRYIIIKEEWSDQIFDIRRYHPTIAEYFEYALSNPNGCDNSEEVFSTSDKTEAMNELAKYRCSYSAPDSSYRIARFETYELDEVIYDEDGDIEDYKFLCYAEVDSNDFK